MGLFIRSLLIVMIVKSQAEVQGNQKTVCCELDTSSKIDELESMVKNYLTMVNIELRNTNDQVKDTGLQVEELQERVSSNQEIVTSEIRGMRRELEELKFSVSALVELLHGTGGPSILAGIAEVTSGDISNLSEARTADATERFATTEADAFPTNEARTAEVTERTTTEEAVALPKDCSEILARGVSMSGVYTVQPLDSGQAFQVYCDMETDGGGWTVFQRRQDGSVDFYLDFSSYSRGFGNLEGEFWFGNDKLHRLTAQGEYELRIDLSDFENESRYAAYDSFSVADVSDNYRLTLGSYTGTAGNSLSYHNNNQFSTKDRDNDADSRNCAQTFHGAWWYKYCGYSNLNGVYLRGITTEHWQGVLWYHWKGLNYSLKTSEMKIRPTRQ